MKWLVLVIFTIMIVGAFIMNSATNNEVTSSQTPQVLGVSVTEPGDPLLRTINNFRLANGVGSLQLSLELKNLTSYRVADMISRQYYSHKTPDSTTYADLLNKYNINDSTISCENLQLQVSQSVEIAIVDWSKSSNHRSCLLNPNLTRGAVAQTYYGEITYSSGDSLPNYILAFIGSN